MNYPWEHTVRDGRLGKTSTQYARLAHPSNVLALIAENKRLERKNANQGETIRQYQDQVSGGDLSLGMLIAERDQLKAENEALRKERDRLAEDNRGLLEDFEGAL